MVGNIILVRTNSWFGKNIRKMTNSYYNHVGIFISKDMIVEATMWGVKATDFSKFKKRKEKGQIDYSLFKIKNLTDIQKWKIIKFAISRIGNTYDFIQLLSLFWIFITKRTRKLEPVDVPFAYICSELVASALDYAGLSFNKTIDKDCITPQDISTSEIVEKI